MSYHFGDTIPLPDGSCAVVISCALAGALYLVRRGDGTRAMVWLWDVAPSREVARMALFEKERKAL